MNHVYYVFSRFSAILTFFFQFNRMCDSAFIIFNILINWDEESRTKCPIIIGLKVLKYLKYL